MSGDGDMGGLAVISGSRLVFLFPMARLWLTLLVVFGCLVRVFYASAGEEDPLYRSCREQCETTGYVGQNFVEHCQVSSDGVPIKDSWYRQEPLYIQWKQWNCKSDCQYHCMMQREKEREGLGLGPVKYHGKWPLKRIYVFQEPVSAALSALNLLLHFNGWLSFCVLLYYKLPLRPQSKKTYYEFTGLWHIHGLLAMNAMFWSVIRRCQDFYLTEKLDHSSAAGLLGCSLILALLRTFNVKDEASRVMITSPLLAFLSTHILYLNFYQFDYGLNMKVCIAMGIAQVLLWAVWAAVTSHPSKLKLWVVVFGGSLAMLLEAYDFPPYKGYVDAHALRLVITIPLTYLWWIFIKEDAEFRTSALTKKAR